MGQFKLVLALSLLALLVPGCQNGPKPTPSQARQTLELDAAATVTRFKALDPGLRIFFDTAAGYAVFPEINKGAFIVGGAGGNGVVFERGGGVRGYSRMRQATVGAQVGGQAYSEVVFFKDRAALQRFEFGDTKFAAQASAVAAGAGASSDSAYENGVLVFTMARGGLMVEASVGGQTFEFLPLNGE